jgi:hypothetical protein
MVLNRAAKAADEISPEYASVFYQIWTFGGIVYDHCV